MNLTLTAELEEFIRQKVRSGYYESPAQVVEEALLLLEERDHLTRIRRERLLRELASGVFQANNRQLVDGAQVFAGLQNQANAASE
jgi:antitoxin ParD1/3/4